MDISVNQAATPAATAGTAFESAPAFAFPTAPAQPAPQPATQPAGQKGADAVDAQRSADPRGKEPRSFVPNKGAKQKDIGKAFDKEAERQAQKAQRDYDAKLAADPVRTAAMRVVRDLMRSKGITQEQAIAEFENGFFTSVAERDGISPAMARMIYEREATEAMQAKPAVEDARGNDAQDDLNQGSAEEEAEAIVAELASMQMPEGFDMEAAIEDEKFRDLLLEYGAKGAVRLYHAEKRAEAAAQQAQQAPQLVADQLRARAAVPQSTRASATSAEPDFTKMSRAEFRKYQQDNHLI